MNRLKIVRTYNAITMQFRLIGNLNSFRKIPCLKFISNEKYENFLKASLRYKFIHYNKGIAFRHDKFSEVKYALMEGHSHS